MYKILLLAITIITGGCHSTKNNNLVSKPSFVEGIYLQNFIPTDEKGLMKVQPRLYNLKDKKIYNLLYDSNPIKKFCYPKIKGIDNPDTFTIVNLGSSNKSLEHYSHYEFDLKNRIETYSYYGNDLYLRIDLDSIVYTHAFLIKGSGYILDKECCECDDKFVHYTDNKKNPVLLIKELSEVDSISKLIMNSLKLEKMNTSPDSIFKLKFPYLE